jgi:hypothetical protein
MMKKEGIPVGVVWGQKDNNSWREASNPLLYDAGVGKKPAYYGVRSALRHRVLEKEKEIETGIEELKDGKVEEWKEGWHTLDGQPLNGEPTESGIYIKSGKKIVVGM